MLPSIAYLNGRAPLQKVDVRALIGALGAGIKAVVTASEKVNYDLVENNQALIYRYEMVYAILHIHPPVFRGLGWLPSDSSASELE